MSKIITDSPAVQAIERALVENPVKATVAVQVWRAFSIAMRGASQAVWGQLSAIISGAVSVGGRIVVAVGTIASDIGQVFAGIGTFAAGLSLPEIAAIVLCALAVVAFVVWWKRSIDEMNNAGKRSAVSSALEKSVPGPVFPRIQPGRVG